MKLIPNPRHQTPGGKICPSAGHSGLRSSQETRLRTWTVEDLNGTRSTRTLDQMDGQSSHGDLRSEGETRLGTIMTSPDDGSLEDLLYGSDLGDEVDGAAAADNAAVPVAEPIVCGGCGQQVCERFFLLAAGSVWHSGCLRCSQCQCELQTHPSLFCRDGNIYCQQDYCSMFGGGQCARCYQPIPASALVMRSGELTFHPQCFSCQECDVRLVPGNLYCMQGQNLYCQSHCHGDRSDPPPTDPQPSLAEGQVQVSGEGEDSVSSPEPRRDDRAMGGRTRRRTKRIRTCFRSEQLRALESYFAQKHNPDGKDWTCLAYKTGLPKRVLQVWFQNARAKLRRSLAADDSQVSSPCAPSRGVAMATSPPSPACSLLDQSQPFPSSTIDHQQLSLLTTPLRGPPGSPAVGQSHLLQSPDFFLDCSSQNASGCLSPLEAYGEAERQMEADSSYQPHYC